MSRKELSWLFPGVRLTTTHPSTTHRPDSVGKSLVPSWGHGGGCHPCTGTRFLWDAPDTDAVPHLPVPAYSVLASTA